VTNTAEWKTISMALRDSWKCG